jgi:hypothetical protein
MANEPAEGGAAGGEKKISLLKNPKEWIGGALKSGGRFIWNNKKKTFINRTFLSWGFLFYSFC